MAESNAARWRRLRRRLVDAEGDSLPGGLQGLAQAMVGADETTMTHDECLSWLPSFVEAEMGGLPAARLYPEVKRHLDGCANCEAEYAQMLELAMAEEAGELPPVASDQQPDLSFIPPLLAPPSLSDVVRAFARHVVAATQPDLQADLRRVMDPFFRQVERLGGRFQVGRQFEQAMGMGQPERLEASRYLAATHLATQSLVDTLTPDALDAQAVTGELRETLRRLAEQAARSAHLDRAAVQAFAATYADLGVRDRDTLSALLAQPRGG